MGVECRARLVLATGEAGAAERQGMTERVRGSMAAI
jgi:hypothetical protein